MIMIIIKIIMIIMIIMIIIVIIIIIIIIIFISITDLQSDQIKLNLKKSTLKNVFEPGFWPGWLR